MVANNRAAVKKCDCSKFCMLAAETGSLHFETGPQFGLAELEQYRSNCRLFRHASQPSSQATSTQARYPSFATSEWPRDHALHSSKAYRRRRPKRRQHRVSRPRQDPSPASTIARFRRLESARVWHCTAALDTRVERGRISDPSERSDTV